MQTKVLTKIQFKKQVCQLIEKCQAFNGMMCALLAKVHNPRIPIYIIEKEWHRTRLYALSLMKEVQALQRTIDRGCGSKLSPDIYVGTLRASLGHSLRGMRHQILSVYSLRDTLKTITKKSNLKRA